VLKFSKKYFELPTIDSVPGLTASHDSEWLELYVPARHVPASGRVAPAGTG